MMGYQALGLNPGQNSWPRLKGMVSRPQRLETSKIVDISMG